MKMLVLRNNVRRVLKTKERVLFEGDVKDNKELVATNVQIMIRRSKINSSKDAMMFEVVVVVPQKNVIYQVAVSEAFHLFDVQEDSRNYTEALEMAKIQFNHIDKMADSHMSYEAFLNNLMITRQCPYFDINSPEWKIAPMEVDNEVRAIVFGKGESWDFGTDIDKAHKHHDNLINKNKKEDEECVE